MESPQDKQSQQAQMRQQPMRQEQMSKAGQMPKGAVNRNNDFLAAHDFLGAQRCPKCGTSNDPQAVFCEQCGHPLKDIVCPHCGAHITAGIDYCEECHNYIGIDRCSFCYAPMSVTDDYCQECGSPRKGIVCPTCHSVGKFGFCEHCGTPLTDRARLAQERAWDVPFAQEVRQLEKELETLWRTKPVESKQDRTNRERIRELRDRVMTLLHEMGEDYSTEISDEEPSSAGPYMTPDDLKQQIEQKRKMLQALLDKMEMPAMPNPAKARNISMACKPHISKLAWRCNYKNALHATPLACACPQQGGKWVILSGNEVTNLVNDK